jgi:hypothetical protein
MTPWIDPAAPIWAIAMDDENMRLAQTTNRETIIFDGVDFMAYLLLMPPILEAGDIGI